MGQKVNPHGMRVGVIKDWDSRWFTSKQAFGDTLVEDHKIRTTLKKQLYAAGVPKIEIERTVDSQTGAPRVKVNVFCAKPGIVIGANGANELYYLRDRWREQPKMWEDCQVFVHGDATPDNFLFGDGLAVISFDLERLKRADRVFDTGRVAAELMHFFLLMTGNKYAAEPFIGHFLWEYACHFPDRERTFEQTTRRVPFYMGTTLLRIARNPWLDWNYRLRLIHEAKQCLRRWYL